VVKLLSEVTIVSIDFDSSEVTFSYDPAKLFPKMKEKDWLERFDQLLKQNSKHTFGAKPLSTVPKDKLTRVEIAVAGNACKGCDLSAYEILAKVDGVEQATASFKDGKLTALIDPARTNRDALVDLLKKRQVTVK
jgi:copper chaperone CopZ